MGLYFVGLVYPQPRHFNVIIQCYYFLMHVQVQAMFPAFGDQFYIQLITQSFYFRGTFIGITTCLCKMQLCTCTPVC